MKRNFACLLACMALVTLTACGGSATEEAQPLDPATQPEAQAALFQRTCDRVQSLIESKDYENAKKAIEVFKDYKLTPEQQEIVRRLNARIPGAN